MPLTILLRLLFGGISLAVLAGGGYLLWSWWDGDLVRLSNGDLVRFREDWRLWTAVALLAWSVAGRFVLTPVIARGDRQRPGRQDSEHLDLKRGDGRHIAGPHGASLYVETHGAAGKPTLVFTHGWGLDSTIWDYAKRDLAGRYRLVLWDLPGVGKSKMKRRYIGLSSFAEALGAVIQDAGPDPVFVVGHSIGGMTIQTLARDNPQFFERNVAGAILLNTTYTNPLNTMVLSGLAKALRWPVVEPVLWLSLWLEPLAWLSAWQSYLSGSAHLANRFGFGKDVTRSQLNATALLGTRNPPGALAKGNLAMFRWDATGAIARLPTPALVIGGTLDLLTRSEASEDIPNRSSRSFLRIVDGVGHMGFVERSDLYEKSISDFIETVVSPAASPPDVASLRPSKTSAG